MTLWLLLFGTFVLQESASTSAVLLLALQAHYNVWLIHMIFLGTTVLDIAVGYSIGAFVHARLRHSKLAQWSHKKADEFRASMGTHGQKIALVVYTPLLFPFSTLLLPWLGVSFVDALLYSLLGELVVWYSVIWLTVLGVHTFVPDPQLAPFYAAFISVLVFGVLQIFQTRRKRSARIE